MIALLCFFFRLLASPFKPTSRLEADIGALRHQLIVLQRPVRGPAELTNPIACSSSSCIDGFPRSSRQLRSSGPRHWCAGIVGLSSVLALELPASRTSAAPCSALARPDPSHQPP